MAGALCCDECGGAPARKLRCPFNYCGPAALCPTCRAREPKGVARKRQHADCKRSSIIFHARERRTAELLAHGFAVRCAALGQDGGRVHVLFRKRDGSTVGCYMAAETYAAIPLLEPATPGDYERFGVVEPAPADSSSRASGAES